MPNLRDINALLDALYLELLNLIEQLTECKVLMQQANVGVRIHLARSRYTQGPHSISIAHIPTEKGDVFNAICNVIESSDESKVSGSKKSLVRHKVDKDEGFLDPLNWFSVLPSSNLRRAAELSKKSVDLVIESANIQTEMLSIMQSIEHLKTLKHKY